MDANTLTVTQIKWALKQHRLSIYGKKAELIQRMNTADPTGEWVKEARQYGTTDEDETVSVGDGADGNGRNQSQVAELEEREADLISRERELLRREVEMLRRENDILRASPSNSATSGSTRATTSIKSISELVGEYKGEEEDFERWRSQINLLRATYELDENTSKILIGSKLRGKALEWYHSRADHLAMGMEELLKEMQTMFERPIGRLELRKKFEAREWQKEELFSEYCHHKLILGNKVSIAKEEMVDYIINGIPSETLRNQARMHLFSSVQEVMQAFSRITLKSEQRATSREVVTNKGVARKPATGARNEPSTRESKGMAATTKVTGDNSRGIVKCYGCKETGHYAKDCPSRLTESPKEAKEKKSKPSRKHIELVEEERGDEDSSAEEEQTRESQSKHEDIGFVDLADEARDEFQRVAEVNVNGNLQFSGTARIDTGCPVSLIKNCCVNHKLVKKAGREWNRYSGINNSRLRILGIIEANLVLDGDNCEATIGVVPDDTMSVPLLLGRNVLKILGYSLTRSPCYDKAITEIFNISTVQYNMVDQIQINGNISRKELDKFNIIFQGCYIAPIRPEKPKIHAEANILLKDNHPIRFGPRRLCYADKDKVREILDILLEREIIRPSTSEFAFPIVLTRKKNGEIRMCVDYRALNKVMVRDNYPLPLIEDQLDMLKDKCFFSKLDLKDGFYHISMAQEAIIYLVCDSDGTIRVLKDAFWIENRTSTIPKIC